MTVRRLVSHDGVELVADVWNEGVSATLLLLPAGGEVRTVWREVVPRLDEDVRMRWRIVAPDHRGHGDSGRSERYNFALSLADLHCWIDSLDGRPLVAGGGSIGGALAMVAAGEGASIDGVVLLDVPTVPVLEKALGERRRMQDAGDHPAMGSIDPQFLRSGFIEDVFKDIDRWRRAAVRLRMPTLLIGGARGAIGDAQLAQYREHVPHGSFERVDAGHLVARDAPGATAHAMSAFLRTHFALG